MRTHAVSMGLALLLSLSLTQLSVGGHACCCCAGAQVQTPCVACPSACGTVAQAPCCSTRAVEPKQPAHTPRDQGTQAILSPRTASLFAFARAVPGTQPSAHRGTPLFIVYRALLL